MSPSISRFYRPISSIRGGYSNLTPIVAGWFHTIPIVDAEHQQFWIFRYQTQRGAMKHTPIISHPIQ
jgi:hypothetical protein